MLKVHFRRALAAALMLAASGGALSPLPVAAQSAYAPATLIDSGVAACDDFYRHACGGYLAAARPDAAHPVLELATQQFEDKLAHSFAALFAQDTSGNPELGRLRTFYQSCLGSGAADVALVKTWLARIDAARTPAQIQDVIRQLSRIGVEPFFTYSGQPDRKQWDHYRGELHNSYLWADSAVVARTFVAAGQPEADAQRDAQAVAALVTSLRKVRGDRYDASSAENPRTLAQLKQLAPAIEWTPYFAMVGAPRTRAVNVTAPAYLQAVDQALRTRPVAEVQAFLRWSFLFGLRGEVPAPYNAAFGDINPGLRVKTGDPDGRCRDATVRAMGVEFSRQYAQQVLGMKARDAAKRIAEDIKQHIVAAVDAATWLSPEGRRATAHKLAEADLKIGFPDTWPEVGAYRIEGNAFFANVLTAWSYEQQRTWHRAQEAHSRTKWDMIVSPWVGDGMAAARLVVPNGFPDALSNSIIMTAAFLGAPRFDADAPVEANFGTFGTVFAHEFVHAAETSSYGADGREEELWSPADIKAEERQGQCVVAQASAYEALPGLKLNGERQYGENVADLGGMRLAFEALKDKLGEDTLYRADASGMSPAQRFFYAFAQSRCQAQTEDYLRKAVASDGHAPPAYRVNGPLTNLPEFGRAFHCQPAARMLRPADQQCRVW